jgi:HK97 family phage prohead protease
MERKEYGGPFPVEVVDEDQGIAREVIAVYGNVDRGNDRLHPGAFAKTIAESMNKVMVVDSHDHTTVRAVLGVCLGLEEVKRDQLPVETQEEYPDATGGVIATTRYLLSTPEGYGAFERRKAGALPGSSFGYDAIKKDVTPEVIDGTRVSVRELREIRLYEYGPCVMGMNPATSVVGVKTDGDAGIEGKPWGIFTREGEYCVYAVDAEGAATGESRGCHPELEDAEDQVAALYASTDEGAAMSEAGNAGLTVPDEEPLWWAEADIDTVIEGVQAWAAKALGEPDDGDAIAGLGEYLRSFVSARQEEGATEGKAEEEAGPDPGVTPLATEGEPEPTEGNPPTWSDDVTRLAARIRVAQARLDLAALDT